MTCDFICEENHSIEVKYSIKEGPPAEVICPICNKKMSRVWQANIQIPEWFHDDTFTTINKRMEHAPRPSGAQKRLY